MVFACWETGFAAVQSLLEQALALGPGGPVHLWWCGRRRALRYRDNYCRALADSDEAIAYRGVELPRPEAMADWVGSQVLPIAPAADVFVVAPDRALAGLRAAFIRLGAAPQRLRLARLD